MNFAFPQMCPHSVPIYEQTLQNLESSTPGPKQSDHGASAPRSGLCLSAPWVWGEAVHGTPRRAVLCFGSCWRGSPLGERCATFSSLHRSRPPGSVSWGLGITVLPALCLLGAACAASPALSPLSALTATWTQPSSPVLC